MVKTPLTAQECYLLERYTSVEYYSGVVDAWEAMVRHVETLLDQYMHHLPAGYRKRPRPKQPDIVWGERVLPNFRDTLQIMRKRLIRFQHGDWDAYSSGGGILSDFKGQSEFWPYWMDEVRLGAVQEYSNLIGRAAYLAGRMSATYGAYWFQLELSKDYEFTNDDPWTPPTAWPKYQLNPSIQYKTGQLVTEPGIYWPKAEDAAVQFLFPSDPAFDDDRAPKASVGKNSGGGREGVEPTTWIKVERVLGETVADGLADLLADVNHTRQYNVAGGHPCPREGWWFTPAETGGKSHYFKSGEIFPVIEGSQYGDTFWQWTQDQEV